MLRLAVLMTIVGHMAHAEVFLNRMTSPEVAQAIANGTSTVIIPTGGTEQNGPHMVLGKHNIRVKALSHRVANALGDTLVAPVIDYVPEGNIDPPQGHMRFPGTISVPDEVFALTVEYAARSMRQAGFAYVVLLGDSGGNQRSLSRVAAKLNEEWNASSVLHANAYYESNAAFVEWLKSQGIRNVTGGHAALADTSLLLAIDPGGVRSFEEGPFPGAGSDPAGATADLGHAGIAIFVERTSRQIRKFRGN